MKRISTHLTFANVVACVALFVALGGVGYAAVSLPKNSVGPGQLRNGAVRTGKIGKGAVTPAKLSAAAKQALAGPRGAQGDRGLRGVQGDEGPRGLRGPQGNEGPRGIQGDRGLQGVQGIQGERGEAGLTASAFSQDSTLLPLAVTAQIVNEATITIATESRIVAQASIQLEGTDDRYCFLTDGNSDWSVRTRMEAPGRQVMGLVGAKVLPPGSYTVQIACGLNEGIGTYDQSDLALIAAAA